MWRIHGERHPAQVGLNQEIDMSRWTRISTYAVALLSLPAGSLLLGLRALSDRDRPDRTARLVVDAAAMIPRPPIDPAKPTVVVLLGTDLTEITDALGPYEMFARAGKYNVVTASETRQPTLLTGGLWILPHYSLTEIDSALGRVVDIVVIPNLPNAGAPLNRPVIDWIRTQAAGGSLMHSWCKGAMALAEAGLLDGGTATAHWGDIPELEERYPLVTWLRGVRWIDRGQYVMSAGITSGIDASLRVLVRVAGDSVARRVAREIRYPNYHFALNPHVEPYSLRPADLVLLANAAFRPNRPLVGVALYDGVGELDLSNVYDAHVHTMAVRVETLSGTDGPVVTAHGLTLYPSLPLSSAGEDAWHRLRGLKRLLVPGLEARQRSAAFVDAFAGAIPAVSAEYIHADEPHRFGLEPVIEDLAITADAPTARFALRRLEYRSNSIRIDGNGLPLGTLSAAIALALAGLALALVATQLIIRLAHRNRTRSHQGSAAHTAIAGYTATP